MFACFQSHYPQTRSHSFFVLEKYKLTTLEHEEMWMDNSLDIV